MVQSEHALRSAEAAYTAGRVDALALLDAERVLLDVRLAAVRARADLAIARARLEGAIAAPLEYVGSPPVTASVPVQRPAISAKRNPKDSAVIMPDEHLGMASGFYGQTGK
jgi:hypothetical protein